MQIVAQKIPGVFAVATQAHRDDRGAFARIWCEREFAAAGIDFRPVQANLSGNAKRHTLRGLHYQAEPHGDAKFVHAIRGRAFDVVVDLRTDSPAFHQWIAVELDSRAWNGVFIPKGCAHGFLTLEDDTDILYHMGEFYHDGLGRGVRWDDPAFGIVWPARPAIISDRDATYPSVR